MVLLVTIDVAIDIDNGLKLEVLGKIETA